MPLLEREVEFLSESRRSGGLIDISCYLERHAQQPSGIIEVVERSTEEGINLCEADEVLPQRPDRRSVTFMCGDCDQVHELYTHHAEHVDNKTHLHADNGGALLLDPRIRVIPGFNTPDYWRMRICSSIDLKLGALPEELDPEVMLYIHLPCGQARGLKMMAWDSVMSGCKGKQIMKRIARNRREARQRDVDNGRPFRTALLLHVHYGDDRRRTYYVKRHLIMPIATRFSQQYERERDRLREAAYTMANR